MTTLEPRDALNALASLRIWRDGVLLGPGEGAVSVWDHGFLYGDGVFEGIRIRERRVYRLADHLQRLRRSCAIVSLALEYSEAELAVAIAETAEANGLSDAHVRLIVTRGVGEPGLDPTRSPTPSAFVMAYPFPPTLGTDPIAVTVSSVVRKAPRSVDANVKSLNYLDAILAKLQAIAAGTQDAIMLDGEGYLAEATGSNLFCVRGGRLETPECTAALDGITRRIVLELAQAAGIPTRIGRLTIGELYAADEAFLTGTGSGIVAIGRVDGRLLAQAPGPITQHVQALYGDTWLSPDHSASLDELRTGARYRAREHSGRQ